MSLELVAAGAVALLGAGLYTTPLRRWVELSLLLLMVTSGSAFTNQNVRIVVLLGSAAIIVAPRLVAGLSALKHKAVRPLLWLPAASVLSVAWSIDREISGLASFNLVVGTICAVFVGTRFKPNETRWAVIALSLGVSVIALLEFIFIRSQVFRATEFSGVRRLTSIWPHLSTNSLAFLAAMLPIFVITGGLSASKVGVRMSHLRWLSPICVLVVFLTRSRGSLLLLLLAFIVSQLFGLRSSLTSAIRLVVGLAVGAIGYLLLATQVSAFAERAPKVGDGTVSGRISSWGDALEYIIRDDIFIGKGYRAGVQIGLARDRDSFEGITTDNIFIDSLLDMGVIGIGVVIAMMWVLGRRVFRNYRITGQVPQLIVFITLAAGTFNPSIYFFNTWLIVAALIISSSRSVMDPRRNELLARPDEEDGEDAEESSVGLPLN